MTEPNNIELDDAHLNALLDRIEQHKLTETDYPLIADLIRSMAWLSRTLEDQNLTIRRLRKIFGFTTERTSNISGSNTNKENAGGNKPDDGGVAEDLKGNRDSGTSSTNNENSGKNQGEGGSGENPGGGKGKNKRKGKRFAAADYKSAIVTKIAHQTLKAGYRCPSCKRGNLRLNDPGVFLKIIGQPWLQAYIYELERFRCNTCGKTFTAKLPEDIATAPKYDEAAKAIVSLLKYRAGFPFYRQESLQTMLNTPISDTVLWEMTRDVAECLEPIYEELIKEAAKGECLHNDDTKARILDLIQENKSRDANKERVGINTSAILSKVEGRQIALFFTGRQHAGENLNDVLDHRPDGMPTPTQMCDASSNNLPKDHQTDESNCLAHLRRKFYEIVEVWPTYVLPIILDLNIIFHNEREAGEQGLSIEEKFNMHQTKSAPVMNNLKIYCEALINDKKTEPSSNLGKAIKYMLNHWEGFTLFLRKPGVPLDNNADERLMKRAVLNRKNGLFFKTEYGAYCADVLLSVIETCQLNKVNPYPYFIAIQKYKEHILKDPRIWLPWNYESAISNMGMRLPDDMHSQWENQNCPSGCMAELLSR